MGSNPTLSATFSATRCNGFGDGGLLAAGGGAVHVSPSTISLALADRLTEAHGAVGGGYVSAPVFGRTAAAARPGCSSWRPDSDWAAIAKVVADNAGG